VIGHRPESSPVVADPACEYLSGPLVLNRVCSKDSIIGHSRTVVERMACCFLQMMIVGGCVMEIRRDSGNRDEGHWTNVSLIEDLVRFLNYRKGRVHGREALVGV